MRGHHSGTPSITRETLQAEALSRDQQSNAANTASQANMRSQGAATRLCIGANRRRCTCLAREPIKARAQREPHKAACGASNCRAASVGVEEPSGGSGCAGNAFRRARVRQRPRLCDHGFAGGAFATGARAAERRRRSQGEPRVASAGGGNADVAGTTAARAWPVVQLVDGVAASRAVGAVGAGCRVGDQCDAGSG